MSDTDKPDENEVLRRMLNMPHKDHAFGENKKRDAPKDVPKSNQAKPEK